MEQNEGDPRGFEDLELLPGCTRRTQSAIFRRLQMISSKKTPVGIEKNIQRLYSRKMRRGPIAPEQKYAPTDDFEYTNEGKITQGAIIHATGQLRNGALQRQLSQILPRVPNRAIHSYIRNKKLMYKRQERPGKLKAMDKWLTDFLEILISIEKTRKGQKSRNTTVGNAIDG